MQTAVNELYLFKMSEVIHQEMYLFLISSSSHF